jgi:hypothetical protein
VQQEVAMMRRMSARVGCAMVRLREACCEDAGLSLPLPPPTVAEEQGRRGGAEGPRERRRRRGPRA